MNDLSFLRDLSIASYGGDGSGSDTVWRNCVARSVKTNIKPGQIKSFNAHKDTAHAVHTL